MTVESAHFICFMSNSSFSEECSKVTVCMFIFLFIIKEDLAASLVKHF